MKRLTPGALDACVPLRVDLYDVTGRRLYIVGQIPSLDPDWPQRLATGVYLRAESAWREPPATALQCVQHAILRLEDLLTPAAVEGFGAAVLEVADWVEQAFRRDADVPLVAVLLCRGGDQNARHAVHTACVLKCLLRANGGDEALDRSLLAAALTLHLHVEYAEAGNAFARVRRRYKQDGDAALRQFGVRDTVWLDAVHRSQTLVAMAYSPPRRSAALDKQPDAVQLLALADLFCARVEDEALRLPDGSRSVLRDILIEHGAYFDVHLASLFVRTLGVYPVGTMVLLSSGEIGVVCDLSERMDAPWVCALVAPLGARLPRPTLRDSREAAYAIVESLGVTEFDREVELAAIWGEEARGYPGLACDTPCGERLPV